MELKQIAERAKEELSKLTGLKPSTIIEVSRKEEGGWRVSLEMIEREAIPEVMDILGIYESWLDEDGNLLGFERKKLRKRGDTEEE